MAKAKLKELVLTDRQWLRGEGDGQLRTATGAHKMCCLGFLGIACKIPAKVLEENCVGLPSSLNYTQYYYNWPNGTFQVENDIAQINDDCNTTDKSRLRKLQPYFTKLGYKLVFKPAKASAKRA